MNYVPASAAMRRVASSTLVLLFLGRVAAPGGEVGTKALDPRTVYGAIPVTCKLAYYAQFKYDRDLTNPDIRLLVADPPRTNIAKRKVDGVVMEVLTPKELSGKTICIWLDFAPRQVSEVHYKRGVVYRGYCYPENIGGLFFKAEGQLEPVAEPGSPANQGQPVGSETNRTSTGAGPGG